MAKILVTGGLGWDVPIWLNKPLRSGDRIGARTLGLTQPEGRLGGGAANIAAALVRVGHDVWVCGRIGDDANGRNILQALEARGIRTDFVETSLPTTTSAQVLIEPNGERTIIGFNHNKMLSAAPTGSALEAFERVEFDCLIRRGGWPILALRPRLVLAHIPAYSDEIFDADVVIGGLDDLGAEYEQGPLEAVRRQFPAASWAVITNGAAGLIAQSDADRFEVKPDPVSMVDATGAGDVFMAGLGDGLLAGADMQAACRHAANWGAICVGLEGSAAAPNETAYETFIHEPNAI
jgi:sugar/nucleoside kinase (ribokinase family)